MDDGPDWLTKPTLRGRRVMLRPFEERDIPAMAEALADAEVLKLTGSAHTSEQTRGRRPVRVEGTARDALRFDGAWVDAIYMSILTTD